MSGVGGRWNWVPGRDIDGDGSKYHLINIGTDPNHPPAYATGTEHHHPNMGVLGGHRVPIYREIDIILYIPNTNLH